MPAPWDLVVVWCTCTYGARGRGDTALLPKLGGCRSAEGASDHEGSGDGEVSGIEKVAVFGVAVGSRRKRLVLHL